MVKLKHNIKKSIPIRSCSKEYSSYRPYKQYLQVDFENRCGYCDDIDFWSGGYNSFHVEHFVPKARFKSTHPKLKTDYNNLIYACPYCNIAKGEDWPSDNPDIKIVENSGYIDPCDADYLKQFERDSEGKIIPLTPIGKYMYKQLKLYLKRHQFIWKLSELEQCLLNLAKEIKSYKGPKELQHRMLVTHFDLTQEFNKYLDYLKFEVCSRK
jgi:hypothetical protein